MRFHLVHAGAVIGSVDLRPEAPSPPAAGGRAGRTEGALLLGVLEPTPAYEAVRPVLQALTLAPPGPGEALADVIERRRARFAALGLALRTTAGAPVTVRFLDVMDPSGELPDLPPEQRALMTALTPVLVGAQLAGRRRRQKPASTA